MLETIGLIIFLGGMIVGVICIATIIIASIGQD